MNINDEKVVATENLENFDFRYISPYAAIFNETCSGWLNDSDINTSYLRLVECYFNEILKLEGFVLLSDVYQYLGIECNKMQSHVGWIYIEDNQIGDNFIDLGLTTKQNIKSINKLLDPNVDGCIGDDPDKLSEAICQASIRKLGL